MKNSKSIETAYELAKEQYAELGVDCEAALKKLETTPISMHCWQADDVSGFENSGAELGGGLAVTGSFPGKARNITELRADLEKAYSLIPGKHKLNVHAIYGDFDGKKVDRTEIDYSHYKSWVEWGASLGVKLDFNASCFGHAMADSGFTISSTDKRVRDFWIDHIKRARKISSEIGKEQGATCVHNLWVPDGMKNTPFDRWTNRKLLEESLDEIFTDKYDNSVIADAVESKLFGLGSEAYVVGSHEFYLGYAIKNRKMVCLDTGHFHPTETISDKLSAVLQFTDKVLMHISRGVRWDSDHVVTFNDDVKQIMAELVAGDALDKAYIALDYFDGSINRTCAYVSGMRSSIKALLCALLMPAKKLSELQESAKYGPLLSMLEGSKGLPWTAVWDMYCLRQNVPCGIDWIGDAEDYLAKVSAERK